LHTGRGVSEKGARYISSVEEYEAYKILSTRFATDTLTRNLNEILSVVSEMKYINRRAVFTAHTS
jgi:hypothetical protein